VYDFRILARLGKVAPMSDKLVARIHANYMLERYANLKTPWIDHPEQSEEIYDLAASGLTLAKFVAKRDTKWIDKAREEWSQSFAGGMLKFDDGYFKARKAGKTEANATLAGANTLLDAFIKRLKEVAP
jgi:hypothetical protein